MKVLNCILLLLILSTLILAGEQDKSINLLWNIEVGGGDMINTYGLISLTKIPEFYFGFGGSFTYEKEEHFGVEYSQYFYTISGVVGYKLFNLSGIIFDLRERIGNEFMSIGDYSSSGILFSTDMLVGYKNVFGVLAIPVFFGKEENAIDVRLGLGYQFNIY